MEKEALLSPGRAASEIKAMGPRLDKFKETVAKWGPHNGPIFASRRDPVLGQVADAIADKGNIITKNLPPNRREAEIPALTKLFSRLGRFGDKVESKAFPLDPMTRVQEDAILKQVLKRIKKVPEKY